MTAASKDRCICIVIYNVTEQLCVCHNFIVVQIFRQGGKCLYFKAKKNYKCVCTFCLLYTS